MPPIIRSGGIKRIKSYENNILAIFSFLKPLSNDIQYYDNLLINLSNERRRCLNDGIDERYLRNMLLKNSENKPIL